MKTIIRWIPNTITCLNLLSGAVACIFAFHCTEYFWCLTGLQMAWICIGAAALFDFLDGAAARLLRAYSELGKQLDSLSDLVSFGLAPAFLVFNVAEALEPATPAKWVALLIPVMGALRLAKFNIDATQTTTFRGLPIPANAIFWIGATSWMANHGLVSGLLLAAVIVTISLTMVGNMTMFSLKFKNFTLRDNSVRYLQLICTLGLVCLWGVQGFAAAIILYFILSRVIAFAR